MSNKRKSTDESETSVSKKLKSPTAHALTVEEKAKHDHGEFIELMRKSNDELEDEHADLLQFAIDYFRQAFPVNKFFHLPAVCLLSQIYCLVKNRTQVDRRVEELRLAKSIIAFKSDDDASYAINGGANNDIYLCEYAEFVEYIAGYVKSNAVETDKWLVDVYLTRILPNESNELSIEKATLMEKYKLAEKDLTGLIKLGLFTIKDVRHFWFALPDVGRFRRMLLECRRRFVGVLRKRKHGEVNVNMFFDKLVVAKNQNFKHVRNIGAIYLIGDMLGKEVVRKVISPMGLVIKLNT
jgi:serine/threonine-protein kinase 19